MADEVAPHTTPDPPGRHRATGVDGRRRGVRRAAHHRRHARWQPPGPALERERVRDFADDDRRTSPGTVGRARRATDDRRDAGRGGADDGGEQRSNPRGTERVVRGDDGRAARAAALYAAVDPAAPEAGAADDPAAGTDDDS